MADGIDGGILLHLDYSVDSSKKKKPVPKKKKHFSKELHHTAHQNNRDRPSSQTHNSFTQRAHKPEGAAQVGRGVKRKTEHDDDDEEDPSKRNKPFQVISSLFTFNPDIPNVQSSKIEKHVEPIFSTDKFCELNLHSYMADNIEKSFKITVMTNVQRLTIPNILTGRDVLVKSQTGSGKTLAYAIPIIHKLQEKIPKVSRSDGPYALVIVPTRELATQSFDTFIKLVKPYTWIVPGYLMGGEKKKSEKARLRKGINVLVTTPGRFLDHVRTTAVLDLSHVSWLVIDEADRLLDMGFEKEVSQIIEELNQKQSVSRQTVLVSATLTAGVERLAGMSLADPVRVDISSDPPGKTGKQPDGEVRSSGGGEDKFVTPDQLKQQYVIVPSKLRLVTLAAFVLSKYKVNPEPCKMVIFLSTQFSVDFHHDVFTNCLNKCDSDGDEKTVATSGEKIDIYRLHGEMEQKERTKEYSEFCAATSGVLLCTDVASRGLDMPQVNWIIQYNTAGTATDYIHRVGRTARAGSQGSSLLFLTPAEVEYIDVLSEHNISLQELSIDDILKTLVSTRRKQSYKLKVSVEESATSLQLKFESYITSNPSALQLAKQAFQSVVRAYATFPASVKHIFHVKNLHIGHVAKSFGLRDAPSRIGGVVFQKTPKKKNHTSGRSSGRGATAARKARLAEFESGLDLKSKTKAPGKKRKNKMMTKKIKKKPV